MNVSLSERLYAIQKWPKMVLPENRYGTLVAYIEGFVAGSGSSQLDGFRDWLATNVLGRESSFHWSTIIAGRHNSRVLDGSTDLSVLSTEESLAASNDLIELIQRYLSEGDD